ncbi:MAG: Diaminopimelate decarboxylase [Firmicutes bacterium ADurb.Bin506]|nr:MAG: Diaminopimelate decarboxylase [Firmicutes bacterium ADurb.Bin506]
MKHIEGVRTYVSVDGGMADNPRVALYQAEYDAVIANKVSMEPYEKVSIAGNCCESGDMLIYDIELPKVEVGDIVAVLCTGAYNFSMASNYNRHPRPAAVLVANGQAELIALRETYADTCRLDIVPPRLMRACSQVAAGKNA